MNKFHPQALAFQVYDDQSLELINSYPFKFGLTYQCNTTLMNRGHVICELIVAILIINQAFKCSDQSELKRQASLWD